MLLKNERPKQPKHYSRERAYDEDTDRQGVPYICIDQDTYTIITKRSERRRHHDSQVRQHRSISSEYLRVVMIPHRGP